MYALSRRVFWLFLCAFLFSFLACDGREEKVTPQNGTHPDESLPLTVPEEPFACNPLLDQCLAPFPSNLFTVHDPSTATGIRLSLSHETFQNSFSTVLNEKASALLQPGVFDDADGFSPLGLILIPLPESLDPACLPGPEASALPDSPIYLMDMASGLRLPIDVRLDPEGLKQSPPQYILVATTRDRAPFKRSLLMVLTRGLLKPDGSPLDPFPKFQAIRGNEPAQDPDLSRLQILYSPLFHYMVHTLGINLDEVLLAFDFTIRSEDSLTRIPLNMREQVLDRATTNPPSFHVDKTGPGLLYSRSAVEVLGTYPSPDFRTEEHILRLGPDKLPVSQEDDVLQLLLIIPSSAARRPAPVVIFGHGFLAFKETMVECSAALTEAGFAVAAIDIAAHGSRSQRDGFIGDYLNVENLFQMRDAILQTVPDELQLCRLVQSGLSTLDVVPYLSDRYYGDGIPDLDTSHIYFISQSLGSMIGTILLAYEPSVEAAILNVPGGGLINIFRNSTSDFIQLFAAGFFPPEATSLERVQLMALQQMPFDLIDPLNYAHHVITSPLQACTPKQVLLQQSIGDGFVPYAATASLARGLGLPLIEPYLEDIPDIHHVPAPAYGSGLFQFFVSKDPALAHALLLMKPAAHRQILEFYRSSLEEGVARIINP